MLLLSLDVLLYHLEIPKASLYIQLNISSKLAFEMKRQMNTKLTQQVPILQRLWVLLAFLTSRFNRRFWHLQVKQKSHKAKRDILPRQDILEKCLVVPLHLPTWHDITLRLKKKTQHFVLHQRTLTKTQTCLFLHACIWGWISDRRPPKPSDLSVFDRNFNPWTQYKQDNCFLLNNLNNWDTSIFLLSQICYYILISTCPIKSYLSNSLLFFP